MAAPPRTSLGLCPTGRAIKMACRACRPRRQCARPAQRWDARPFVPRCSNGATRISLSRCTFPSVRSSRATSQTCVTIFLPTPTSVERGVCASIGGAPTSAVSPFFVCVLVHAQTKLFFWGGGLFAVAYQCYGSKEYDACHTGCEEDCSTIQSLPGDWSVAKGNHSACMDTPIEGCFCTGGTVLHHGKCVAPQACRQCEQQGRTYEVGHRQTVQNSEGI